MITQIPELIVIGYTVRNRPGLWQILGDPQPPGNYGADAAEKWRREKLPDVKEKIERAGLFGKLTGSIQDVVAVNISQGARQPLLDTRSLPPAKNRSALFVRWLNQQGFQFPDYPRDTDMRPCAFYGFDPKPFVRIVGMEAMLGGVDVPTGFWYMNEECISPYEMLVEADRRKVFPLAGVCKFAAVQCSPDYQTHVDPVEDARIAAELTVRFGLYPFTSSTTALLGSVIADHLQQPVEASEPEPESELEVPAEPALNDEAPQGNTPRAVEIRRRMALDPLDSRSIEATVVHGEPVASTKAAAKAEEEYEEVEEEVEVAEGEEGDEEAAEEADGEYEYDEEEVEVEAEAEEDDLEDEYDDGQEEMPVADEAPGKRLVPRTRRGEQ